VLADDVKAAAPTAEVTQHIDDDQTFRYADASGDRMPIHLDAEFAQAVGLPGIIVHGLCTMAFLSWATTTSVGDGDPTRLRRLAVRFSKPVLPGQDITTRFWLLGTEGAVATYGFETTNPDGDVVIKDGLAEVAED
jgi:acyl dehydratase